MRSKLVKGQDLTPEQVRAVKAAFTYRWTKENLVHVVSTYVRKGISVPTMLPVTDEQWLNDHAFYIRQDGTLADIPKHCEPAYMADDKYFNSPQRRGHAYGQV